MKLPAGCEHRFWSATASSVRSLICTGGYFGPIWIRWARVGALGRVLRPLVSERGWLNPFGDEAPRTRYCSLTIRDAVRVAISQWPCCGGVPSERADANLCMSPD